MAEKRPWRRGMRRTGGLLALMLGGLLSGGADYAEQEVVVFRLESLAAVRNNPKRQTVFVVDRPTLITKIWTYHWNDGAGAKPGIISLRNAQTRELMGVWEAVGTNHMFDTTPGAQWPEQGDGPPYLYWTVLADQEVPPGSYEVIDSDINTWATNDEMKDMGCAWVYGRPGQ